MKKLFFTFVAAIAIIASGAVLNGCSSSRDFLSSEKEFLELDMSNLTIGVGTLTDEQMRILDEAKNRIDRYVVFEDGRFSLLLKSGCAINISESLFDFLKSTMKAANYMLENTNVNFVQCETDSRVLIIVP